MTVRSTSTSDATIRTKSAVLALLIALIVLRDPTLFIYPRLWAEEATVYLKAACESSPFLALLAVHQGYFSLWANLAGVLATIPPLEYAPWVTTAMSLLVLVVILIVVLASDSEFLNATSKKFAAGLAVLLVGATGEIWLTSINSQHYFPLLLFLSLIDSKQGLLKRRTYYLVGAVAGLSSVAANFLTPLFLLRYWQRRERADLILFFILVGTSVAELFAIWYSAVFEGDAAYYHSSQRRSVSDFHAWLFLQRVAYYTLGYPLFGSSRQLALLGAALVLVALFLTRGTVRDRIIFMTAVLLLTCLGVLSSLRMEGGPRYAYSGSVIFVLMVSTIVWDARSPVPARLLASALLAASSIYWTSRFWTDMRPYRDSNWPVWHEEVKQWRNHPGMVLQAHPIWRFQTQEGLVWQVNLDSCRPGR